ncbi:MAG: hypothetical protein KA103_01135 [Saprospiraceae bacterium]|nr:hypothetical protein [Saprospiraceae bacterium]
MLRQMANMIRVWICLYGFLIFSLTLFGQPQATAHLDADTMYIGDQQQLHITVKHGNETTIRYANLAVLDSIKSLEIIQKSRFKNIPNGSQQNITITLFEEGVYQLPPTPVVCEINNDTATIQTNSLAIVVLPPKADTAKIAPIKDIIKEPATWLDYANYLLLPVLLIALAILGYRLYNRYYKKKAPTKTNAAHAPDAYEVAMQKLAALRQTKMWEQPDNIKTYYSDLTFIIREYIEKKYAVSALEQTTDEIIKSLHHYSASTQVSTLRDLLNLADMVKFAKAQPQHDVHLHWLNTAEQWLTTTNKNLNS